MPAFDAVPMYNGASADDAALMDHAAPVHYALRAPGPRPLGGGARGAGTTNLACLQITGVTHRFAIARGGTTALADVDLSVPRGSFVSLIGPSGCGKSTLLRIAAGLLAPSAGEVTVFGGPVGTAVAEKNIGFVPQSPALLPWRSVVNNVQLSTQVNRDGERRRGGATRDAVEVLKSIGLGDFVHARPSDLSGGMQQRVALARALVFDPAILLMDEPFSALDELTRERQRRDLLKVAQREGKTVLFVTHSVPEAVLLSDTVAIMSSRPGRIHRVVPVDLPRPRDGAIENSPHFRTITTAIREELQDAWALGRT